MTTMLAVMACLLSVLGLIAGILALRTLGQLRRRIVILNRGGDQRESLLEATGRHAEAAAALARKHDEIAAAVAAAQAELGASVERATAANTAVVERTRHELTSAVAALQDHVDGSSAAIRGEFSTALNHLGEEGARGLRRIALVRYDAFDDMAGRMSFSLALLDEYGDGVTISAIAGRSDTRVYAKGVSSVAGRRGNRIGATVAGGADLTPEEQQAIDAALAPSHAAPYPAAS